MSAIWSPDDPQPFEGSDTERDEMLATIKRLSEERDAHAQVSQQRGQQLIFMEDRLNETVEIRDNWCAEFVKARNALLKIRDATEGSEDGSPDANPHDKLCNEIMGMVREVIADDDENRNDL